jgi:hypothetical protein
MWLVVKVGVLPRARGGRGALALSAGAVAVGATGAASWAKLESGKIKIAERNRTKRGVFMDEAGNGYYFPLSNQNPTNSVNQSRQGQKPNFGSTFLFRRVFFQ